MARKPKSQKVDPEPSVARGQVPAALLLLVALVVLASYLFKSRADDPRYAIDLDRAIDEAVAGHPDAESISASLRGQLAGLADGANILASGLTSRIEEVLARNPWVKKVKGTRRVFPGRLELDIELREPYAELEVGGRYLLVDEDGEVLPQAYDESRGLARRLVLHPDGDPQAPVGAWEDAWLRDAIRNGVQVWRDLEALDLGELVDLLGAAGVVAIDISNHAGRLDRAKAELSLISAHTRIVPGSAHAVPFVIRWGRSTIHHLSAIELSPRRKLENLKILFSSRPRGFDGLRAVDLRFDDPIASDP